jgi:hypothetical protein
VARDDIVIILYHRESRFIGKTALSELFLQSTEFFKFDNHAQEDLWGQLFINYNHRTKEQRTHARNLSC